MRLTSRTKRQLALFAAITIVAASVMVFGYMSLPAKLFGIGRYTVTVQLPRAGGLYANSNVTYRGTEVGRVADIRLTDTGVDAVLSLRSGISIPSDLAAQVHSVSGIGEQYVALLPRNGNSPPLRDGDVIPQSRASVPPDINSLLDATNRGLEAIPPGNLKTDVDQSFVAVGGLGPEISRIVNGSTQIALDARANLDYITSLIDHAKPVLDAQAGTKDSIQSWASHLADITRQLQRNDRSVAGLLEHGGQAAQEAQQLIERVRPTLPLLLANLVSINQVAIGYQAGLEQLLVLLPQGISDFQAAGLANRDSKHPGGYLDFNLNLNLPTSCTTGYLPAQQQRTPTFEDVPEPPSGDVYCRIPQNSQLDVRGARNFPCLTKPGKRAPSARMCESNEEYVPLNDGNSWKGDPNATYSGQDIPQLPPGQARPQAAPPPAHAPPPPAPPPPLAIAQYDPATGAYVGPDGRPYTQTDLGQNPEGKTWQSMLTPPS